MKVDHADMQFTIEEKLNRPNQPASAPYRCKLLTPREMAISELLIKGGSAKMIAISLDISPYTVRDHLKSIYLKLNAHSKNQAIYKLISLYD